MPTPIGHGLSGMVLLILQRVSVKRLGLIMATLFFSVLPDSDFLFGYWAGNPNLYHHQATHSLVFVIIAGIVGGMMWGHFRRGEKKGAILLFTMAGVFHLLLDTLSVDTTAPYGMPLLWPFWSRYVIAPVAIFSDVHRSSAAQDFFFSLWNRHNFYAVLVEMAALVPFVMAALWWRRRAK